MARHRLDARGLLCPLPVLRAQKLLKTLESGEVLVVEATDAAAPRDFAAFCQTTGHRLLASGELGGEVGGEVGATFIIEIERA